MHAVRLTMLVLSFFLTTTFVHAAPDPIKPEVVKPVETVAGSNLQLNGSGTRYRLVVPVYVASLYLPAKTERTDAALAQVGAKRIKLAALRTLSADDMGRALMAGLRQNLTPDQMSRFTPEIAQFGQAFGNVQQIVRGDELTIDWIPGRGLSAGLNGKRLVPEFGGEDFYRAVMRIWLGDKPVDAQLKQALLGLTPEAKESRF